MKDLQVHELHLFPIDDKAVPTFDKHKGIACFKYQKNQAKFPPMPFDFILFAYGIEDDTHSDVHKWQKHQQKEYSESRDHVVAMLLDSCQIKPVQSFSICHVAGQ